MKVGEAIVGLLESYGVRYVFGIPGTHSIEMYRGLEQSGITHVLPRHEQGAGFMADGYARLSGQPGVCFVITGPGVTNISTAMAQAWSDAVPMLVISPINDPVLDETTGMPLYQGRLHEITDQTSVTESFTSFSEIAVDISSVEELIHRAFQLFWSDRPQPVHIHVPLSVLRSVVESAWQPRTINAIPSNYDIDLPRAVAAIQAAKRPVIVAGGGCRHFGELLISLAEKSAAPVVTSVAGRGVIQGSNPLCAGAQLASENCKQLIADSDLLLAIGCELSETDLWSTLLLPSKQIWINLDKTVPFQTISPTNEEASNIELIKIETDAGEFLPVLSKNLDAPAREAMIDAHKRAASVRNSHVDELLPGERKHWRVLTELVKRLPEQAIVTSDMTQLAYTACNHLPLQRANSWFHPNGYGTLGYALPAAIGAMLAHEDTPALAIVGDAGFQYTFAELAVAVERKLSLVVLLWNNDALQQIADDMVAADIEPNAVVQVNPDFELLVQAMGADYKRIKGLNDLGPQIEAAFNQHSPVVIELHESVL